jgi:hypothetical protein
MSMMNKHTVGYFLLLVIAIAVGASLFLSTPTKAPTATIIQPLLVLEEGTRASMERKVNYHIQSQEELATVWAMVYPENAPLLPQVDFNQDDVLAVFDGSKPSGGHAIKILHVIDEKDKGRVVTVVHEKPAGECMTTQEITSPFQFVVVKKSPLPIIREDIEREVPCQ